MVTTVNEDAALGDDLNAQFWLVRRAQVGRGFGMRPGDDQMSDTIGLVLWCHDLDKPGLFALLPDHAETLAHSILDSVEKYRRGESL